jgi:hypothetical protein
LPVQGEPMEKRDDFYIPEETAEWISLKKSEYLSKLIQLQGSGDFGFEEFHLFDEFIPSTIENPDKAYEAEEDNQKIRIYLRTYKVKTNFHQVVIGAVVEDKDKTANVFVPILTFITRKDELVKEFCVGEVITRPTLN